MTKIALIGYGKEAKSAYNYTSRMHSDAQFIIYDHHPLDSSQLPKGSTFIFDDGISILDVDADIVFRTPSADPSRIRTKGRLTSVTQEFLSACPVPVIGVTGTKGKGTTATLVSAILSRAGIKNWLVGNIGLPALDSLDEIVNVKDNSALVVYEMSSFQLWDLSLSPHIAVLLMIEPEHLDVHSSFDQYRDSKQNITRFQSKDDVLVYFKDNQSTLNMAKNSLAKKIPYSVGDSEYVVARGKKILLKNEVQLKGVHNLENVTAAVTAAMEYVDDVKMIADIISNFHGLPHRLEVVSSTHKNITFINDSYSSAPPATIAALNAVSTQKLMIIGGKDRGLSFSSLATALAKDKALKQVLIIGEIADKIATACDDVGFKKYEVVRSKIMKEIVDKAMQHIESGDTIIFSPGCASFDMFDNFTERGEQFKKIVGEL